MGHLEYGGFPSPTLLVNDWIYLTNRLYFTVVLRLLFRSAYFTTFLD